MQLGLGLRQRLRETLLPAQRQNKLDNDSLKRLIAWSVPADGSCIDVGAHAGEFTRHLQRIAGSGQHLAYEPLPEFAARLRREFTNSVSVREMAVSDRVGTATFTCRERRPAESGFARAGGDGTSITVEVTTLDHDVPAGFTPTLVKIDVEDHELEVIRGAARLISDFHPLLAFEHGVGDRTGELHDLLTGFGYRLFDMDGRGPYTLEDMARSRRWNWIAR